MTIPPRKRIDFDDASTASVAVQPVEVAAPTRAPFTVPQTGAPARHSTRVGKRGVQMWLSPEAYRQLRLIAAKEDLQIQDCLVEALDLFFQKRGAHRIAGK
jgi:hypothetical protein